MTPLRRSTRITYPFPLEDGTQGFFYLPPNLRAEDVKRMVAFLNTLVTDSAPTSTSTAGAPDPPFVAVADTGAE